MTLHVTNGDHAGDKLRGFVDGPVIIMADVLHEGPCPPVDGEAWHELRARFLASDFGAPYEATKASLTAADEAMAAALEHGDENVLWFEHDLFDQLQVIRILDLLVRLKPDMTAGHVASGFSRTSSLVSLICIDRFPGIDRFIGLGQLTAAQLAMLPGTRLPVTRGHFTLASDAWRAFRSPDPSELLRIAMQLDASRVASSEGGAALRFLGAALLRFLAEFPSTSNGLSRTEQLALEALAAGPSIAGDLFGATQLKEAQPFLGDLPFFDMLRRLASANVPLVTVQAGGGDTDLSGQRAAITHSGRDVLAGRADHVRLNGIDVWRGGVHLAGSDSSPWRWDERDETLVS